MKRYRRTTPLSTKGTYLKQRIAQTRTRAQFVGILYLLGIFALAAAACMPLLVHDLAPIGVLEFWKQFKPATLKNFKLSDTNGLITLANCSLYALMLLGLGINALRALSKLGWLNKKRASKTYGFNRNVYAMDDLGSIFSGSFAVIVATYFLIAILCDSTKVNTLMLIVLGGGVFWHLFLGVLSTKIAYFDIDKGQIVEQKRQVGRFSPLFRNVLQLATVFGIMYFFLKLTDLSSYIAPLTAKNGIKEFIKDTDKLVSFSMQILIVLCLFVLLKHATAITEYNIEGPLGYGMKNFRVFAFFTFLAAGAAVAYKYVFMDGKVLDKQMLIIAGIAFAMFLVELIMNKMPRHYDYVKEAKQPKDLEEEFTLDYLLQQQNTQQQTM